jgi:hypothetical protein
MPSSATLASVDPHLFAAASRSLFAVTVQVAIAITALSPGSAQEATKDLLAAQIRDQGYSCDKPVSAQRDLSRSRPGEAAWVLKCASETYRLRLIPDMAARVERLN